VHANVGHVREMPPASRFVGHGSVLSRNGMPPPLSGSQSLAA